MKFLLLVLLLPFAVFAKDPEDIVKKKAIESVALVSLMNGKAFCSSTFIKYKDKVRHITNNHCCVEPMMYNTSPITIVKTDPINDICEISHDNMPKNGLVFAKSINILERSFGIGFSSFSMRENELSGFKFRYTIGNIAGVIEEVVSIISSSLSFPGMSGGPLLNSKGEVLGQTKMRMNDDGYLVATPFAILQIFLDN
jgi:hypothetical protein